ncbi:membrane protein [Geomonas limicola]|uniref:Membrane protein n=1 Tax=Geomonas limicola TaxID=2740186 RepID=A0A6V8NBC7_9BACT|nr:BamA/TamA family outer membrane protein [Geomonas limicola]GFO69811.1 membrane protein [Geomonas limicola]
MRTITIASALATLVLLSSCTYQVPRKYLPYPVSNESFADPAKTVAIPLPVIAASPNEGITYGGLIAFLLHNARDEVSTLIVPQMNYNQYFGVTTTLYGAFYPNQDQTIRVNLSQATTTNHEYRLRYLNQKFLNERWELNGMLFDFTDGSARFFGFQSTSSQENETNYAYHEVGFSAALGYRFTEQVEAMLGERFKKVGIWHGAIPSVPFITEVFPADEIPGLPGYHVHDQRLSLIYTTLDSPSLPTSGSYLRFSIDISTELLGSSATYHAYDGEAKMYYPTHGGRFITVARLAANQTVGHRVPFLEQSILGGETTLRGYGQNRFIDKSFLLLNLEERIRLFRWEIFNVTADWELAPFIDLGSVMSTLVEAKARSFEFNPGLGLRTVVRPNIVGRIDVGVGREGPAVFVGLGYPF